MKHSLKILATIILLIIFNSKSHAQYRSFILGIKAAPTISWMATNQNTYNSEGVKIGFDWGVAAEFYFTKNYALVTGLNFIYQGGKLSYDEEISSSLVRLDRDYRIRYLEIPAILKLKTNEIGDIRYFGQIGLGLGIRTSSLARDSYDLSGRSIMVDYYTIDGQTRLFRTSMIVGAGIEYPFDNNTALILGVNFNNGFSNVLKGKNNVNFLEHRAIPNFVELNIGIMF